MQGVLKKAKEKDYVISIGTADEKKEKDAPYKKDLPKLDQYISLMGQLIQVNSSLSNHTHAVSDNIDNFNDKRKAQTSNKNVSNEGQEQKFSITHLKDKSESLETHKKGFFLITDELKEEEDDMSLKLKRDVLVSKLMYDRSIIIDKQLQTNFNDSLLSSVFLSLSNESRKVLIEQYSENPHDYNMFHNIIGFKKEKSSKNFLTSNEAIMNMCEKLVRFEDLLKIEETPPPQHSQTSTERKSSIFITKLRSSQKFIYEDEKKQGNTTVTPFPVEIKKEQQIEITNVPVQDEEDEQFDHEEFNFFVDFIKNNENHPIKDKIEKILELIQSPKFNTSKESLQNKMKNEILRNLKQEYLSNLEELNKLEEENILEREREEAIMKKRNFKIENPFEETLETYSQNNTSVNKSRVKVHNQGNRVMHTPNKNKVIYTQKGWGLHDPSKKPNAGNVNVNVSGSNVNGSNVVNTSSGKKQVYVGGKNNYINTSGNISSSKQSGKKIIYSGNQKIIYNKNAGDSKQQQKGGEEDVWIGTQMESDDNSEGEWVEQRK